MKPASLLLVSAVLFSGAALAQHGDRDSDRRSDRYGDTPQFIEPPARGYNPRPGDENPYANRPGAPNPYAPTPGAPNAWAPVPGAPPASVPIDSRDRGYYRDRDRDRDRDRPGSASRGSTVRAAPNPNSANLLPEEQRFGGDTGGGRRR